MHSAARMFQHDTPSRWVIPQLPLIALLLAAVAVPGAAQDAPHAVLSTWLGGQGEDGLTSVAWLPDGRVVMAGSVAEVDSVNGIVAIVHPGQGKIVSQRLLDHPPSSVVVAADSRIIVAGPGGVSAFDGALQGVLWTRPVAGKDARIVMGPDQGVIVLVNKRIHILDRSGQERQTIAVGGNEVLDIAYDSKRQRIYVTGYKNHRGSFRGRRWPIQVVFVHAFDLQGERIWTAYDFPGQAVLDQNLEADTRGYRLFLGADDKLYLAGESAGGSTLAYRSSTDVSQAIPFYRGDAFQNWFNTRANHITMVLRLDPEQGVSEGGTLILARLGNERPQKGNTIRPRAIAVDAAGFIYVAGASASSPPVSEQAFGGNFEGGGAFFMILDQSFRRVYATKLANGAVAALAVSDQGIALVGTGSEHLPLIRPLKDAAQGKTDGWLVVLRSVRELLRD